MNSISGADATALPAVDFGSAASPRRQLGTLAVRSEKRLNPLPLTNVQIAVRVADRVAEVSVSQTFVNSGADLVEVVYIFPLSGGCSVSDFEMTSSGRTIKAVLAEREEARRDYKQALENGESAALLEQERDDVFTVSVGNLPAGEKATVRIIYSERLPFFEDGWTELRVPLVVAPRYIPGFPLDGASVGDGTEPDTDQVPDASRITPPRIVPGFDPGTSLRLEVELLGAVAELSCSQHAVRQVLDEGRAKIELSRTDELLNRDFVLRWRLVEEGLNPSLAYYRRNDGEVYGLLSIMAPRGNDASEADHRDVVFMLDRSGSMGGAKMASAARACECLLRTLGPSDRFGIVAFDNGTEWIQSDGTGPQLIAADEDGLGRAERWLRSIEARGGTEVAPALAEALDLLKQRPEGPTRSLAIVLITDGEVGNEGAVLERLQRTDRAIRLFTVGVDTAVNAGFLTNLARIGGGTSVLVEPGTALEGALVSIGRDIGRPLVTDLTIEDVSGTWLDLTTLAPSRLGDLFGGRATSISFRTRMAAPIRVRGTRHDGSLYEVIVDGRTLDLPAIAHLWARARVSELEDQYRLHPERQDAIREQSIETSIRHRVLSRFTAYLAVNWDEVVMNPTVKRKIVQPVHEPAGWQMPQFSRVACLVAETTSPYDSGVREIGQLAAEALDLANCGDLSKVEKVLRALTERLRGMLTLEDDDVPPRREIRSVHEALDTVEESLAMLRQHRELRGRLELLVRTTEALVARGASRWLDEAITIVEESRARLGQLKDLESAFVQSLDRLRSLTQSLSLVPRTRTPRFWDGSV